MYLNPEYDSTLEANRQINIRGKGVLDVDHLIDESTPATDTVYYCYTEGSLDTYNQMMIQVNGSDGTGIEFKVWITLDDSAVEPSAGDDFSTVGNTWIEKTTDIFGGAVGSATTTSISEAEPIDTSWQAERMLFGFEFVDQDGTADLWVKRYSTLTR